MPQNQTYSVSQLSKLAGISIRTLHYYDEINLLKPIRRSDNGYRVYGNDHLVRLQQILVYRALDFTTDKIKEMLHDENFDVFSALENQKRLLLKRQQNIKSMIKGLEASMNNIKSQNNIDVLYEGTPKEDLDRWDAIAREREGNEKIDAHRQLFSKLSDEKTQELKRQGENLNLKIASSFGKKITSGEVQSVVKEYHDYMVLSHSWISDNDKEIDAKAFKDFAISVVEHTDKKEAFESLQEGLAEYFSEAMIYYCDNSLC